DLIDDVSRACHFTSLGLDAVLLFLGPHGAFQCHPTVLRDHLHVVRVGGQAFVVHQRAADPARDLAIARVLLLLIGRGLAGTAIPLVHFRVVGRGLGCRCNERIEQGGDDSQRECDSAATILVHTHLLFHRWTTNLSNPTTTSEWFWCLVNIGATWRPRRRAQPTRAAASHGARSLHPARTSIPALLVHTCSAPKHPRG